MTITHRTRLLPRLLAAGALTATAVVAATTGGAGAATAPKLPTSASAKMTAVNAPVSPELAKQQLPPSLIRGGKAALDKIGGDPRVTAYWTTDRLKKAISLDTPSSAAAVRQKVGTLRSKATAFTVAAKPTAAPKNGVRAKTVTPVTNFPATNGKVFFTNPSDGKGYMCSGAAVNSGSKRLVVTAGHCVYNADSKKWMTNWQFIPGYRSGARPYGTFQAAVMRTYNDWMNWGTSWTGIGWNSDVGFVTTYANASGRKVVNAVGGQGLVHGGSMSFDVDVFGYPGNLNSGEIMWACWGTTGTKWIGFFTEPKLSGCNFGGGASGGPWLYNYSNATGLGYVRSVTSNSPSTTDLSNIGGPYFDSRISGMYTNANADGLW